PMIEEHVLRRCLGKRRCQLSSQDSIIGVVRNKGRRRGLSEFTRAEPIWQTGSQRRQPLIAELSNCNFLVIEVDQLIPEGWRKCLAGLLQQLNGFRQSALRNRPYSIEEFNRVATAEVLSPAIDPFFVTHVALSEGFPALLHRTGQADASSRPHRHPHA